MIVKFEEKEEIVSFKVGKGEVRKLKMGKDAKITDAGTKVFPSSMERAIARRAKMGTVMNAKITTEGKGKDEVVSKIELLKFAK